MPPIMYPCCSKVENKNLPLECISVADNKIQNQTMPFDEGKVW